MPQLKSMKRSPQELTEDREVAMPSEGEEYPYGLRLHLEKETLEKLGISLPAVGENVEVAAIASVSMVRSEDSEEFGQERSVTLQITELGVAPAQVDPGDRLYPSTGNGGA